MTAFNSKTGGFHLTTVGRVQTPTLALMVDREDKIRKFKRAPTGKSKAFFPASPANIAANGSMKKFAKGKAEEDEHLRPTAYGTKPAPKPCRPSVTVGPAKSAKKPKPRPSSRPCCTT